MTNKILICIPFFYKLERLLFLKKIMNEYLHHYVDYNITIVIDTNNDKLKDVIYMYYENKFNIIINVHPNLDHNFLLTWQHRAYMITHKDEYDIFIYSEDDMLIPYLNFVNYMKLFDVMWTNNCIPNFIRIEKYNNILYNSDNLYPTKVDVLYNMDNKIYCKLNNPYNAFWILPKHAFNDTIARFQLVQPAINGCTGGFDHDLRVNVAGYPIYTLNKMPLVEIIQNEAQELKVAEITYAYHLPNNYSCVNADLPGKCGNLRVDNLLHR